MFSPRHSSEEQPNELFRQYLLKKLQGPWIAALAQPEHGLLPHRGVLVGFGYIDQQRHAFAFMQLAEGKDGFFLDLSFRIVFDGLSNFLGFLATADLGHPEDRLSPHMRAWVLVGHADQLFY